METNNQNQVPTGNQFIPIKTNPKIKIEINNIETFLIKSNYLKSKKLEKDKLNLLKPNPNKFELLHHFEFNENITLSDVSVNYGPSIQYIKKIFNCNLTIDDMYTQYLNYTKRVISLNKYINCLLLIEYIFKNFSEIFFANNEHLVEKIIKQKVEIFDISNINNNQDDENIINEFIDLYDTIESKPTFKGNNVNKNLIILVFLVSMGNEYFISKDIADQNNLLYFFNKYNNIYVSNIQISLFLYIYINLIMNMHSYASNTKTNFFNYRNSKNNLLYKDINENDVINVKKKLAKSTFAGTFNVRENTTPNLFLFDNENIITFYDFINNNINNNTNNNTNNNPNTNTNNNINNNKNNKINNNINNINNNVINLLLFQNYLKLYSLYNLNKNKIRCTVNLTIYTVHDFFSTQILNNKKENRKNIFNNEISNILDININYIGIMNNKEILTQCFSYINFNELLIKITGFIVDQQVTQLNNIYFDLVKKSRTVHFQESFIANGIDLRGINIDNSLNTLSVSFNIINNLLNFYGKIKEIKKLPKLIIIKLNFCKLTINNTNKEIQIYFDYSTIKEKILFQSLITSVNILVLIQKYQRIIRSLAEFKLYECMLRVSQTNFRSKQLNFIFKLITKSIVDFVENEEFQKINICEKKLPNFNKNLSVYIKNSLINKKNRISNLKNILSMNPIYANKLKILHNYIENLDTYWDLIVISNNQKEFQLLRTFDDCKLFIYITRESIKFTRNDLNTEIYEYINFIMYLTNDQNKYQNALDLIDSIVIDSKKVNLDVNINIICDRFYIEYYVLTQPEMKNVIRKLYNDVDNLYLIAKPHSKEKNFMNKENLNYDIHLNKKYVAVCNNHMRLNQSDEKYAILIKDFLTILSSCVEVILYILKKKEVTIEKFIYVVRINNENYFSFEYKKSNILIKKIKEFDSLYTCDLKKSYPFFCLLSKIPDGYFELNSGENFYEIFLRLFLNLNKVADKPENLNGIFFQKIHKGIFYQYYDTANVIFFNYEFYIKFNDFFISNNYLKITNNEKFEKCYMIPINSKIQNLPNNNVIFKSIIVFNYNFNSNYIYKNFDKILMSYRKIDYIVIEENIIIDKEMKEMKQLDKCLYKLLKKKIKNEKNFVEKCYKKIVGYWVKNEKVSYYERNTKEFEKLLDNYNKEKIKLKAQTVNRGVLKVNDNLQTKANKKDCSIF